MTKLILSVSDLKDHIAINFIGGFEILEPFIKDREKYLVRRYIGDALYLKLGAVYALADGSTSASASAPVTLEQYKSILYYCQRIVANLAIMDYIPEGQLDISENGIRISTTGEKKQAFEWQIKMLADRYQKAADSNLENLLEELLKLTPPEWTSSAIYKKLRSHFVRSATEFENYFNIDESHLVFIKLLPDIDYVERTYIRSILGDAFLEEMKERLLDGESEESSSVSTSEAVLSAYRTLFDMIAATVCLLTAKHTSLELADDATEIDKRAAHLQQQLQEYLNANASDTLFAKYFKSEQYTAPLTEEDIEADESETSHGVDNSKLSATYATF
ncbi:MAG: hypothetical protein PF590_01275 [Candidatus Delongbacteria bacterium]|jgi:hypothetical protein|nr:hypothetical protein [Candidatus Delongbacteria bacterium]